MFLFAAILVGIYLIYRCYLNGYVGLNRILLTLFLFAYALTYVFIPPFLGMNNAYAGRAFELFPIGCYLVALIPDMDEASSESKALVYMGWLGLLVMATFLVYFKQYVW